MSNLGSMRQRIRDELPRRTSDDTDRITNAIITSIKFYRSHRFYFNNIEDIFATTIGKEDYGNATDEGAGKGYNDDLFGIQQVYIELSGSRWVPVDEWPFDTIRLWNVATTVRGYADFYAWHNQKFWVSPAAHIVYNIRIDGIKDIGTPVATWDGSEWDFFEPDGTTVLTDSFANNWFTEGEELIRLHSKVDLAENVFKDDREANRLARREFLVRAEAQERMRAFRAQTNILPYT